MITKVDIIVGTQFGDEAKGKISYSLLKNGNYTHSAAVSGGSNKGHSYYHNGNHIITHQIPAGVIFGKKTVICCGCVINVKKFFQEIQVLEKQGISICDNLKIAYNAHIVTDEMIEEDNKNNIVGSTGQGIMQCYRAKYGRIGRRAEQEPLLKNYLIDTVEEFNNHDCNILVEGAQGIMLCPDWSENYPYVTSGIPSSTYALHSLGISAKCLNKVYGATKAYVTYSGFMSFQPKNNKILEQFQILGKEIGNTSLRKRQTNFLNLKQLKKALLINGIDTLIFSKMDILQQLNVWQLYNENNVLIDLKTEDEFKMYVTSKVKKYGVSEIIYSYTPHNI